MTFQKAQRKKAKLRLGITGVSGSGKTWSALEIATGMGGKIAMIDTEAGRGELYGEDFDYDVMRIDAPYSPEKYIDAISKAENEGYDILIIDSLSHAWAGDGGILSSVDKAGGNSFTAGWRQATPRQNALVDAIITSSIHIIVTMRSKSDYVIEKDDKTGKSVPKKVGLAFVQRDGLEFEFTVFMDMSNDHIAHINKDNTKLFDQQFIKPSKQMGVQLMEWLNKGKDYVSPQQIIYNKALKDIKEAHNMQELKRMYDLYSPYGKKDKAFYDLLVAEKDKKKAVLESVNGTPAEMPRE